MLRRRKPGWIFAGFYCNAHLPKVGGVLGTMKVEAVNKEYVEHDERCSHLDCKELVSFIVYREGASP